MAIKYDVITRVGSQDDVIFQLQSSNAAVDLTGVNYVDLLLSNGSVTTSFRSNTVTSILTITTASTGTLTFSPTSTTFTSETSFKFYLAVTDSNDKVKPFPESEELFWSVRFKYS